MFMGAQINAINEIIFISGFDSGVTATPFPLTAATAQNWGPVSAPADRKTSKR